METPGWKIYFRQPENPLQWIWAAATFLAPVAGALAGRTAAAGGRTMSVEPGIGFLFVLAAMALSIAVGLSLSVLGLFRRPRWALPAAAFGVSLFVMRLLVLLLRR